MLFTINFFIFLTFIPVGIFLNISILTNVLQATFTDRTIETFRMKWFATNFDEDTTELELDYDYYKFKPRNQTFYFENISNHGTK